MKKIQHTFILIFHYKLGIHGILLKTHTQKKNLMSNIILNDESKYFPQKTRNKANIPCSVLIMSSEHCISDFIANTLRQEEGGGEEKGNGEEIVGIKIWENETVFFCR